MRELPPTPLLSAPVGATGATRWLPYSTSSYAVLSNMDTSLPMEGGCSPEETMGGS